MYKGRLSDLSSYVSEKISVAALTDQTYIGVDNMLSNRGGVKPSEYVPEAGLVTKFERGDILLGNIRPYFKKIWLAEFDGGCSPDVLVIRPKQGVSSKFLYAYLSTDGFFDYDMKGAKGSKMPRGDKDHIMRYEITIPDAQEKIGSFIININEKIANNNAICADLEGMAKLLYDYWFVQFDFPDENGNPYKSSGGKMVWNEELKREIPEGWEAAKFSEILAKVPNTEKIPTNNYHEEGRWPIIDQSTDYIAGYTNNEKAILDNRSGCIVFGDHTGYVKYVNFPFARGADGTQVIWSQKENFPSSLLFHMVKRIPLPNVGYSRHFMFLKESTVFSPPIELAKRYDTVTNRIYQKIKEVTFENIELVSLRDFLLPMLMNGQVKVKGA